MPKNDRYDGINDRLGQTLAGKRRAQAWKHVRNVLTGLLLTFAITVAMIFVLVPG